MAKQRWLYLHFYQLTLDNAQATDSLSCEVPAVVYRSSDNQIVQLNLASQSAGIERGMGLAQAAALSDHLEVIDYAEEMEKSQLEQLAAHLYQCVAEISLQPPCGLFIRIDNLVRFYGDYQQLWQTIKRMLSTKRVRFFLACAWSPEAAEVLAKQGLSHFVPEQKLVFEKLGRLPVSVLAVADKQRLALKRSGIRLVQDLLSLPPTEVGKRFDSDLLRYLFALRGESYPKRRFYHPPETFCESVVLPYEVDEAIRLLRYFDLCFENLGTFLRLRNAGSQCITITLHFREAEPLHIEVRKADIRFQHNEWMELVRLKLETLNLPEPIIHFDIISEKPQEYTGAEADFFNSRKHVFARQQLFGKLTARLGENAVNTPFWPQDHRLPTRQPRNTVRPALNKADEHIPTCLLLQPQPLFGAPSIEFGPVRIESGWWDNNSEKRDYFIARNADGQRMQIFREHGQWFLSGWYA